MDQLPASLAVLPPPPTAPPAMVAPRLPVLIVSACWLAMVVVLGAASLFADRPLDVWFWTAVCGCGLGGLGYAIMSWQRSAARRGSRSAQTGLS